MKKAKFLGSSLKTIKGFPEEAKQQIGYEIHRLQKGKDPTDFAPMKEVGSGVFEIRVSEDQSWFRAFYVTKFEDEIHILHAFEKKRNKTSPKDINAGKRVYKQLLCDIKQEAKNG